MLVSTLQDRADPVCNADIRWAVTGQQVVSRSGPPRTFSAFSAVGQTACFPAAIRVTVEYADANDELVCSGVVSDLAEQEALTQMTAFEIRVGNQDDFIRVRNGRNRTLRFKALVCSNTDGTAVVQPADLERATVMRLYATVLGHYGGLATAELRLALQP
jgi:hypothetical protein